jgi:Na+/H+ antiporter NhaC
VAALLEGGHVADLILLVLAIEAGAVAVLALTGRRPRSVLGLLPTIASGFGLALSLRAVLAGMDAAWLGVGLLVALVGHVADVARRLRG